MARVKVTFTLDEQTVLRLQDAANRASLPKSAVVREAILEYHARLGQLGERERRRLLDVFDAVVPRIKPRPVAAIEQEMAAIRQARRQGGRGGTQR
jgi:hypothetical protein